MAYRSHSLYGAASSPAGTTLVRLPAVSCHPIETGARAEISSLFYGHAAMGQQLSIITSVKSIDSKNLAAAVGCGVKPSLFRSALGSVGLGGL